VADVLDPRWLRQVLLPEVGPEGQARIARAGARVLGARGAAGSPGGAPEVRAGALAHEVAERYARGAGFGELLPGAIDLTALAPEGAASAPAAREVLAGARAALAAIRAALDGVGEGRAS
jgi:hypothetical protein